MEIENPDLHEKKFLYFSYGSNHLEQMRERIKNPKLECKPAVAPDYFLVFAGYSNGWDGGTASLAPFESEIAEKLVSNLEEVKARGGTLYVFSDPSVSIDVKSGSLVPMPKCDFLLTPIIYTIPLQILSYEVALLRGTDIDQPRNLAKSVTVE